MKAYLVSVGEYDDYRVMWTFTNRPAAEAAKRAYNKGKESYYDLARVEVVKAFERAPKLRTMHAARVSMTRDAIRGEVELRDGIFVSTWSFDVWPDEKGEYDTVWANLEGTYKVGVRVASASSYKSKKDAIRRALAKLEEK